MKHWTWLNHIKGEQKKTSLSVQHPNFWQKLQKMEIKMQTSFFYVHEVKNEWWTIFQSPIATEIWIMLVLDGNSEMYVKLIIFIIHQLLTILENSYLGSYWALNNGSSLIFYLMDLEKWCLHLYLHFLHFLPKIVMLNCWTFREVFICSPFMLVTKKNKICSSPVRTPSDTPY